MGRLFLSINVAAHLKFDLPRAGGQRSKLSHVQKLMAVSFMSLSVSDDIGNISPVQWVNIV